MTAVVITGSASGLGHVIASRTAAQGHDLVLVDRDEAGLVRASDELGTRHGVAVETIIGDLSTSSGIESVSEELQRLGDVIALVNNAGGWSRGEQYPGAAQDVWMSAITLNLPGFHVTWGAAGLGGFSRRRQWWRRARRPARRCSPRWCGQRRSHE